MWHSIEEVNLRQYDIENSPEWQKIVKGNRVRKIKKLASRRKNLPTEKQVNEMYRDYLKKVFENA